MSELPKKSADGIVYAEFERLARIESAARELSEHEFVSESEWCHGWQSHRARTLDLLSALRKALGDGGGK